jgi:hypothetical protein
MNLMSCVIIQGGGTTSVFDLPNGTGGLEGPSGSVTKVMGIRVRIKYKLWQQPVVMVEALNHTSSCAAYRKAHQQIPSLHSPQGIA